MRRIVATVVTVALGIAVAGCSAGRQSSTSSKTPPTATSSTATDTNAAASSDARGKADDIAAEKRLSDIRTEVGEASTIGDKLSPIITEYCRIQDPILTAGIDLRVKDYEENGLEKMYDLDWRANPTWNAHLYSAASQQGGCPEMFSTTR